MFNIGGGEVLVIAVIALIVLGPQRLPDAARQVGKAMGDLRRLSSGFQNEIKGAFDDADQERTAPARNVLADRRIADDRDLNLAAGSEASPGATAPAQDTTPERRGRRTAPLRAEPAPDAAPATRPAAKAKPAAKSKPAAKASKAPKAARSRARR